MTHRLTVMLIWFLACTANGLLGAQENGGSLVLTLDKAVQLALENNRHIQIARGKQRVAQAQVREARAGAFPQLSFSSTLTRNLKKPAFFAAFGGKTQKIEIGSNNAIDARLSVQQPLWLGGRVGKALKVAELFQDAVAEEIDKTEAEVLYETRVAFYTVLLIDQLVEVMQQSLSQAEAHLANVRKWFDQGMASEFEVLRAEVQVAEVRPELIAAQNNLELAKNGLKSTLSIPLDTEIIVQGHLSYTPMTSEKIERESALALRQRAEMKQLELQANIQRMVIGIERANHLPQVVLQGAYVFQGSSNDFDFGTQERATSANATVALQIPIFDGFRTSARVQQAQVELQNLYRQRELLADGIRIQVKQARLRMAEAARRIAAQQKSVEQAEKAHHIAEVRYNNGIGTQIELFDARLALNRVRTGFLQAIYDYNVAQFEWELAVGKYENGVPE